MKQVIFWGTPQFAIPALRSLIELGLVRVVVTRSGKRSGRGRKRIVDSPVKQLAQEHNLTVLEPESVTPSELRPMLNSYGPATYVTVAYGKIIPVEILALSELPALNLHPSLLPKYRGPSPIQSALLNGETMTGLTLMQMDEQMDHGPIVQQKKILISPQDTFMTLSEKLSMAAAQFMARTIPQYLRGELRAHPQDHTRASYCRLIKPSDAQLDFRRPAHDLFNMMRALNPNPGTYFLWRGMRIKVVSAQSTDARPTKLFSQSASGSLIIACNPGALEILIMKPEGKQAMHSADFLRGHPDMVRH